jgi:N-dimethylarginine dimethylaminohydrolase
MSNSTLQHRNPNGGTTELERWGVNSEYGVLRDVLLGPPEHYRWLETSAISKRSLRLGFQFDNQVARAQHAEMRACYEDAGVRVHTLPADPNLPYQVFARDSSVMTPWGAIVTQMGHWWRRGEYAPVIRFYQDNDIPIYDMISAGGFEGGDFQVIRPGLVFIGYGDADRSSQVAVEQLRQWIEAEDWEVRTYQFDPFYVHGDLFFATVAEGLAAMCTEMVEPELVQWVKDKGIEIIDVPFRQAMDLGCNVVALGNDRVIVPQKNTQLIEQLRARGMHVYDPDISMISNGGGSLHCMCQALRRDPV